MSISGEIQRGWSVLIALAAVFAAVNGASIQKSAPRSCDENPQCARLPGSPSPLITSHASHKFNPSQSTLAFAPDVVVTYKTGSSVIFDRDPTWLLDLDHARNLPASNAYDDWFEYLPNQAYYSDAETVLGGFHFKDILADVSDDIKKSDNFQEYYRIHEALTNRVDPAAILKSSTHKRASKGWGLDKYKFLPIHGDAYRQWPDAKWQIAVEDDTFVFWNQLLKWLKTKDHDAHKLYGNPMYMRIGGQSIPFVHGGSAYVISRGLLKATYGQDPWGFERRFDEYVKGSCCGDAELSRAFRLATNTTKDLPNFSESRPKFQGGHTGAVRFDVGQFCEPIFSLHHVHPFEYTQLQDFKRTVDRLVAEDDFVRFVDLWDWMKPIFLKDKVFTKQNSTSASLPTWHRQNGHRGILSDITAPSPNITTQNQCQRLCQSKPACLLYTFDTAKKECRMSEHLYIGETDSGASTGYNLKRINKIRGKQTCAGRLGDLGAMSMEALEHSFRTLGKRPRRRTLPSVVAEAAQNTT